MLEGYRHTLSDTDMRLLPGAVRFRTAAVAARELASAERWPWLALPSRRFAGHLKLAIHPRLKYAPPDIPPAAYTHGTR